ncbi:MAG: DUF6502 family protein [Steroidobacteraceae bacterium]
MPVSTEYPPVQAHAENKQAERAAVLLLEALVPLLVQYRVTYGHLSVAARQVLVRNAARIARLRNGRINQSEIAATTGLSRIEVRRHLSAEMPGDFSYASLRSKTSFVMNGWLTDKRFQSPIGKPKALCMRGRGATFESLVRKYGRDVPPRAMAAELQRQGWIAIKGNLVIRRKRRRPLVDDTETLFSARLDAIAAIASSANVVPANVLVPSARFVSIAVSDEIEKRAIEQRIANIVKGASTALASLQEERVIGDSGRPRKVGLGLQVALVVSQGPQVVTRKSALRKNEKPPSIRKGALR